jgi:hypothetical protein
MSAQKPTPREFAALAYALAVARGQLSSVQLGSVDAGELNRALTGTSAANIAKALGLKERDLTLDWADLLTESEMHAIRGGMSGRGDR